MTRTISEELEMNTNSLYLALSGENWKKIYFQREEISGIDYALEIPRNT